MLYAVGKDDDKIHFRCSNKQNLDIMLKNAGKDIRDYLILQEYGMEIVPRIAYIDGKCVYNNREYWTKTATENPLLRENFSDHTVLDYMGQPVSFDRYIDEKNTIVNRLYAIDGRAGQVSDNIEVGTEIISLFREECILTPLHSVTPDDIFTKCFMIIVALQTGFFDRASKMVLAIEPDEFLNPVRKQKYYDMIKSADVIEYAEK